MTNYAWPSMAVEEYEEQVSQSSGEVAEQEATQEQLVSPTAIYGVSSTAYVPLA